MAKGHNKIDNLTKDEIIQAIQESGGIVSTIANKLRVHRDTIYNWQQKEPWIKDEIDSAREKLKDYAESKLVENVRSGDQRAIEYLLDHQAIERGYGRKWKLKVSGDKDEPIVYRVVYEDEDGDSG